eukprot:6204491-Pleurochrysis_carterae.AAC.1
MKRTARSQAAAVTRRNLRFQREPRFTRISSKFGVAFWLAGQVHSKYTTRRCRRWSFVTEEAQLEPSAAP